jgi:hypothetical protein
MITNADPRLLRTRPVHLCPISETERQTEALLRAQRKARLSKIARAFARLSPRQMLRALNGSALASWRKRPGSLQEPGLLFVERKKTA